MYQPIYREKHFTKEKRTIWIFFSVQFFILIAATVIAIVLGGYDDDDDDPWGNSINAYMTTLYIPVCIWLLGS